MERLQGEYWRDYRKNNGEDTEIIFKGELAIVLERIQEEYWRGLGRIYGRG